MENPRLQSCFFCIVKQLSWHLINGVSIRELTTHCCSNLPPTAVNSEAIRVNRLETPRFCCVSPYETQDFTLLLKMNMNFMKPSPSVWTWAYRELTERGGAHRKVTQSGVIVEVEVVSVEFISSFICSNKHKICSSSSRWTLINPLVINDRERAMSLERAQWLRVIKFAMNADSRYACWGEWCFNRVFNCRSSIENWTYILIEYLAENAPGAQL